MAWLPALLLLALAACCGVLMGAVVWRRRRRRKLEALVRRSGPLPRVPLRSQVIVLDPDAYDSDEGEREREAPAGQGERATDAPLGAGVIPAASAHEEPVLREATSASEADSVHSAPTREFAAHVEELAALSMHSAPTREISVHEPPTREFAAYVDDPEALRHVGLPPPALAASERARVDSGFQPRARLANERRDEDATLKVGRGGTDAPRAPTAEELLGLLGPSPTPDLGNIEIYYRLGLAYLASGDEREARRCFLTVEGISPGYRDAAAHLAQLPFYAPTSSGATPVHYVVTSTGPSHELDAGRGRRKGR